MWQASQQVGIAPSDLVDFSANINPRGLPRRAQERLVRDSSDSRRLSFYPDPSARCLRGALSKQLDIPAESVDRGTRRRRRCWHAPILQCLGPRRALVPVPAFSEYRRVCGQQRIEVFAISSRSTRNFSGFVRDRLCRSVEAERGGVILLNNPHNPSGSMLEPDQIRRVREAAKSAGATILLDEAFIDYIPGAPVWCADAVAEASLIVLRSLTKFYGCTARCASAYCGGASGDHPAHRISHAHLAGDSAGARRAG